MLFICPTLSSNYRSMQDAHGVFDVDDVIIERLGVAAGYSANYPEQTNDTCKPDAEPKQDSGRKFVTWLVSHRIWMYTDDEDSLLS